MLLRTSLWSAVLSAAISAVASGCGGVPETDAREVDAGDIEGPDPQLRIGCSPVGDIKNCTQCNGTMYVAYCASGETCWNNQYCRTETRSPGTACTSAMQCAAVACTDGVCCNVSACTGGCSFCGFAGNCQIKTGVAPKSCSLTAGAAPCGTPGCYGSASCSYAQTSTTCTPPCVGSISTGFTYGGSGTCDGSGACKGTGGSISCGQYRCDNTTGCKMTCSSDADCLTGAFCEGSVCKPKLTTGSPCPGNNACAAGAGTCQATNDGNRCCTATCTSPMVCNTAGTGCVGTLPIGSACSTGSVCATGICHPTGKCAACSADSDCSSIEFCDVTSLKCVPRAGVGDSCTTSASCPSGLFCTEGVCCEKTDCGAGSSCALTPKGKCMKQNGTACAAGGECGSGNCVDGICCDSACTGQCEACDVVGSLGKCVAVKGAPRGGRPACPGAEVSVCERATCDGANRTSCAAFTSSEAPCRDASCTGGMATAPANCTGTGSCPAPITTPCGGFACDAEGKACRSACTNDGECVDGYVCKDSRCEPKTSSCSSDGASSIARDGASKPCAPYLCDPSTGNCFAQCAGSSQCAAGFVCDGANTCVAAPATDTTDDGGCALGPPGGRASAFAAVAALGLAIAVARRRR